MYLNLNLKTDVPKGSKYYALYVWFKQRQQTINIPDTFDIGLDALEHILGTSLPAYMHKDFKNWTNLTTKESNYLYLSWLSCGYQVVTDATLFNLGFVSFRNELAIRQLIQKP